MASHRKLCLLPMLLSAILLLAACNTGPSVSGAFDRNYSVTGPVRLELTNASGDVDITGSADGKVHIHSDVRASGFGFDNPQKRLHDTIANPPIQQRGPTIRIGKEFSNSRHISITYNIQVRHNTQISPTLPSVPQVI